MGRKAIDRQVLCDKIYLLRGLHMIAYRAMLDVPRELVRYLTGLQAAERHRLGTRRGTRKLTCRWVDRPDPSYMVALRHELSLAP
jgi:hypothetical protein